MAEIKIYSQGWQVDECPDANGNWTIRWADGTKNGDTTRQPVTTAYSLELANQIVESYNNYNYRSKEIEIAENAAKEYRRAMKNPWFKNKPEEKFKLLTRIILGAHALMIERAKDEN